MCSEEIPASITHRHACKLARMCTHTIQNKIKCKHFSICNGLEDKHEECNESSLLNKLRQMLNISMSFSINKQICNSVRWPIKQRPELQLSIFVRSKCSDTIVGVGADEATFCIFCLLNHLPATQEFYSWFNTPRSPWIYVLSTSEKVQSNLVCNMKGQQK